jgi:predicted small secreted protein
MRALFALLVVVVALAACNTMEGVGKDVKAAGSAIERASKK